MVIVVYTYPSALAVPSNLASRVSASAGVMCGFLGNMNALVLHNTRHLSLNVLPIKGTMKHNQTFGMTHCRHKRGASKSCRQKNVYACQLCWLRVDPNNS